MAIYRFTIAAFISPNSLFSDLIIPNLILKSSLSNERASHEYILTSEYLVGEVMKPSKKCDFCCPTGTSLVRFVASVDIPPSKEVQFLMVFTHNSFGKFAQMLYYPPLHSM